MSRIAEAPTTAGLLDAIMTFPGIILEYHFSYYSKRSGNIVVCLDVYLIVI
jgi:hypothetical protein